VAADCHQNVMNFSFSTNGLLLLIMGQLIIQSTSKKSFGGYYMRRRSSGQSVVEMAFVLPVLVLVLFGIVDFGYYIYGYATIYQAARNGAEKASQIPPYETKVDPKLVSNETCVRNILETIQGQATLFPNLTANDGQLDSRIQIDYPTDTDGPTGRELGAPVEVKITYNIQPLTPLWRFVTLGTRGTMQVRAVSRRSIESLGLNPNTTYAPNLIACQQ
jgi:Flp pilus assembly protein TadG